MYMMYDLNRRVLGTATDPASAAREAITLAQRHGPVGIFNRGRFAASCHEDGTVIAEAPEFRPYEHPLGLTQLEQGEDYDHAD